MKIINKFQIFELTNKRIYLPVAGSTVQAGFPSPAAGYEDEALDINDLVVSNPTATFYVGCFDPTPQKCKILEP